MKALGLVFGRTTLALTAVLGAFMAGLALGSWLLGRAAERTRDPLRLYGWIELGIALAGLGSLAGIWLTRQFYLGVYDSLAGQPALLLGSRFLASFVILLVPTTLMGGTYPVVVKYLTRRSEHLGTLASRLYWLNTGGAITGACLAGFVLLWHLGLLRTVVAAAGLNLTVVGLVLFSSVRLGASRLADSREGSGDVAEADVPRPAGARLILVVTAVSGLTGMMFEIGWTRILGIMLSSTTYAFTLMLATFLLGITLGSYLFERFHRRWELSHRLLGQFLVILALGGLLFLALSAKLAELTLWLAQSGGESSSAVLAGQFLVSFLAMIVPTTLFGVIFPATVVLYCGQDRRRGARTGALYAVNTLGAIAGAFLTGLLLVPWLTTVNTLLLASGLNLAVATALFARANPERSGVRLALSVGLLAVIGVVAATDVFAHPLLRLRTVMANANRAQFQRHLTLEEIVGAEKRVYLREGINATVAVTRQQGWVSLSTDGKIEASSGDQHTQLLLADLPLSFHPRPRRVLVVGFGSGSSVYAAAQWPGVERVDCVEIEPAVLEAARYLEELNHGVYRHPKVRIILDDARSYLMVTRERYDVIISEPSYLWSAGIASLYTREFYQQVREHLAPQGLFMQWLQAYQLAPRDLSSVLRTLGTTFDHLSVWRGNTIDFLILSSPTRRLFTLQGLESAYRASPELRRSFSVFLSIQEPAGLLGFYLLDDPAVRQLAAQGEVNTDDRTVLEYRAPFNLLKQTEQLNLSLIRTLRREGLPPFVVLEDRAAATLAAAETQMDIGMMRQPLGAVVVEEVLRSAADSERALLLRASVAVQQGKVLPALSYLQQAERLGPSARVAFALAQFYLGQGQLEPGRQALEKCLKLSARHPGALAALVDLEVQAGRTEEAIELQQRLIAAGPPQLYHEWARLGELYFSAERTKEGVEALEKSLELEPLGYLAHRHVAGLLAQSGQAEKAIDEYRFLIQYYPARTPDLYLELAALYRRAGREDDARRVLARARRIFPTSPEVERALWSAGP